MAHQTGIQPAKSLVQLFGNARVQESGGARIIKVQIVNGSIFKKTLSFFSPPSFQHEFREHSIVSLFF